jgi:hypothetical protein
VVGSKLRELEQVALRFFDIAGATNAGARRILDTIAQPAQEVAHADTLLYVRREGAGPGLIGPAARRAAFP